MWKDKYEEIKQKKLRKKANKNEAQDRKTIKMIFFQITVMD